MNKKIVIIILSLLMFFSAFAQDNVFIKFDKKPKVELGLMVTYNNLNEDRYLSYMTSGIINGYSNMAGVNLKLEFETKIDYLDIEFGALILNDLHQNINWWNPGQTNSTYYIQNGGGVYCGVSPKIKGKHIGLSSEFGVGIFSFKEYSIYVNNVTEPFIYEHDLKASNGLGALSSVGMYVNIWRIGINPSLFAIFTGGANTSFIFYGFNLPISIQL